MNVRPEQVPYRDFYRILLTAVGPRPIAWVSTLNQLAIDTEQNR